MKIDTNPEVQKVKYNSVRIPDKKPDTESFETVLRNSIQNSNSCADAIPTSVQPLIEPSVFGNGKPEMSGLGIEAAQRMLDKLESYQKLLADPGADLRTIHPALGQMEQQAESAKELFEQLPEGHPLRMIIAESLQNVYQEVARFNAGYYVDDC